MSSIVVLGTMDFNVNDHTWEMRDAITDVGLF